MISLTSAIRSLIICVTLVIACPAFANPVQLPAGWQGTPPNNGMMAIQIGGSQDIAIIGILNTNEAAKVADLMASQAMPLYTIDQKTSAKALNNGMYIATAQLTFTDGRKGMNISRTALRADGKVAVAMIITPNPKDMPGFQTRVTATTDLLKALAAGGTLPE